MLTLKTLLGEIAIVFCLAFILFAADLALPERPMDAQSGLSPNPITVQANKIFNALTSFADGIVHPGIDMLLPGH